MFLGQLQKDAGVGAALVELPGGVEETGAVAGRGGDSVSRHDSSAQFVHSVADAVCIRQVGHYGKVVAGAGFRQEFQQAAGVVRLTLRQLTSFPIAVKDADGAVFRALHVRLVERMYAQDMPGDGRCVLPTVELGAQVVCARQFQPRGGMAGGFQPCHCLVGGLSFR